MNYLITHKSGGFIFVLERTVQETNDPPFFVTSWFPDIFLLFYQKILFLNLVRKIEKKKIVLCILLISMCNKLLHCVVNYYSIIFIIFFYYLLLSFLFFLFFFFFYWYCLLCSIFPSFRLIKKNSKVYFFFVDRGKKDTSNIFSSYFYLSEKIELICYFN